MVMDKFEGQFEDLDVQASYMENAMSQTTATATPQDQVDVLMQKVADEAGLELNHELAAATPATGITAAAAARESSKEEGLDDRLRALRS